MTIEIVTTKRKLTKSLVNQMRPAPLVAIQHGTVLGYLIRVVKDSYKTFLIEHEGEYFVLPSGWEKGLGTQRVTVWRTIGRWSTKKRFNDVETCDKWWAAYESVLKTTTQIYI